MGALEIARARVRWEALRRLKRIDAGIALAGGLGLVTLIAAVGTYAAGSEIERLRSQLDASVSPNPTTQVLRDDGGRDLLRRLPPSIEFPSQLKRIYAAAEQENVRLTIAEYRTKSELGSSLTSVTISAVATDDYVRIQRALIEILNTAPNIGLESATFRRPDRRSTRVDARLTFVVYLRGSEGSRQ
jgi:hypothetical protein